MQVAVINRAALWCDFDGALLLPLCAGEVFAMPDQLQVTQASKNRRHPQQGHAGDDQQTDVEFLCLHGPLRSGIAPPVELTALRNLAACHALFRFTAAALDCGSQAAPPPPAYP